MKRIAITLTAACFALPAFAQTSKPFHLVNQFNPGSSGDNTSRLIAQSLTKVINRPVVVENKPGGAGTVAQAYVAKQEPDGNTVLYTTGGIITNRFLSKSIEFDALQALTPVTQVGKQVTIFSVNAKVPVGSFKELIEYAKKNPGKVTYGTSGIGSPHHLSGELIQMLTGVRLTHVPYKASAAALLDTVSGQIAGTFSIYPVTIPHIQEGTIRVLAVVRDERAKQLPDVPIMSEVVPGFEEPPSWNAIFAPGKMQPAVLKRLHADLIKALNDPELRARSEGTGQEMHPSSPEELAEMVKRGTALVARIVKSAGIKPR